MSTGYVNSASERFVALARLDEKVFHARDLANLWRIPNNNTLYTTLKRYVRRGLLFRIWKGFYSLVPAAEIDPRLLGVKALHEHAYVSTETVLAAAGVLSQKIDWITLMSSKSKKFSAAGHAFLSRKLADRCLFNPAGIESADGVPTATLERAVADLLHFNPDAHFDGPNLVDWQKIKRLQKELGYSIISKYYDSPKPKRRDA